MSDRVVEIHINMHGRVIVRYDGGKCVDVTDTRGRKLYSAQAQAAQAQAGDVRSLLLARNQDCGCVVCVCENDERCMGCGAKHCGTHQVGQIPNPRYEQAQASKPIAAVRGYYNGMCVVDAVGDTNVLPAGMALYSQPQAQAGDGEAVIVQAAAKMVVDAWHGRMTMELRDALDYLAGSVKDEEYTAPPAASNGGPVGLRELGAAYHIVSSAHEHAPIVDKVFLASHKKLLGNLIAEIEAREYNPQPVNQHDCCKCSVSETTGWTQQAVCNVCNLVVEGVRLKPAVNQQLLEASRELLESLKAVRELEQPTHTKTGATFKQQIAAWLPVNDASEKLRAAIAAAQEQGK